LGKDPKKNPKDVSSYLQDIIKTQKIGDKKDDSSDYSASEDEDSISDAYEQAKS
jgi:hypothetical protein